MLGTIAGAIIGSTYEHHQAAEREFPLFSPRSRYTGDTVLTIAIAAAILEARQFGEAAPDYESAVLTYARRYPHAGYGQQFRAWFHSPAPQPYNSWATVQPCQSCCSLPSHVKHRVTDGTRRRCATRAARAKVRATGRLER